jgi:hypothetical protein
MKGLPIGAPPESKRCPRTTGPPVSDEQELSSVRCDGEAVRRGTSRRSTLLPRRPRLGNGTGSPSAFPAASTVVNAPVNLLAARGAESGTRYRDLRPKKAGHRPGSEQEENSELPHALVTQTKSISSIRDRSAYQRSQRRG